MFYLYVKESLGVVPVADPFIHGVSNLVLHVKGYELPIYGLGLSVKGLRLRVNHSGYRVNDSG